MTNELKGEMFAWISGFIWLLLLLDAMLFRGSIDLLLGGFVIWTVITILGLTVWALRQGSK